MSNTDEMSPFFTALKIRNSADDASAQALLEAYGRQQVQAAVAQIGPRVESALQEASAAGAAAERERIVALLDSYEAQSSEQVKAMAAEGVGDPAAVYAQLDMLRLLREVVA